MTGGSKSQDRKPGSAEQRILAAASAEFADKGFYGARTQTIADAAGLNKAMLHYYFRSKDNLYRTVLKDNFTRIWRQLEEIFLQQEPMSTRLDRIVDLYLDTFALNPNLLKLMLREMAGGGERLKQLLTELSAAGAAPVGLLGQASLDLKINQEEVLQVFLSVISMCVFTFVVTPFLTTLFNYDSSELESFRTRRRASIKAMLKAYLKEE
ncbi:MAG: TetR family transcriptional regulator [Deltaproteobacteria bacterium]|nr:TetR family transcriptional regulator [Deltaproteobacteria bacterium]MBW2087241.1 TetR family transcriptional regulator [Deltaproteobacteria bacterium]